MICPDCGSENSDSAKFCKQCGRALAPRSPIKDSYSDSQYNNPRAASSVNGSGSSSFLDDNKNLMIICLTVIICAIVIAGAFIFLSGNNDANDSVTDNSNLDGSVSLSDDSSNQVDDNANDNDKVETETKTTTVSSPRMDILSGSFTTGSSKSDKTYCSVYVGEQYAGENVKISVLYSRDGSNLNKGNIVSKNVDGDGYISVPSADSFKYYPDHAFITLYDSKENVLDTQEVSMSPTSGTQTF